MNTKMKFYLKDLDWSDSGAADSLIAELIQDVGFALPEDYILVMKEFNGGEGEIGKNSWLCLFPIEDLLTTNDAYKQLMSKIPDYFLFGMDAADTGYAFHKYRQTIHAFGLMSGFKTDKIIFCGNSFLEFLEYLYNQ
ncbi:MAG: SMI1/KNR4 family protein [Chitinophagaceae bacterium]